MNTALEYSHLWDGSEPGWAVLEHVEDHEELQVVFGTNGPSVGEVKALRLVNPPLASTPASVVLARLKGSTAYSLGIHESAEARRLKQRCIDANLEVEARAIRQVHRGLFNRSTKHYLLIEDDTVREAVVREALNRGLPVVHSAV